MSGEKSGKGFGAIENVRISLLVLGSPDRETEAQAMKASMHPRHHVSTFVPTKPGFFTKFSVARAVNELSPHVIHALGLSGAAASAASVANGSDTALVISLSNAEIRETKPQTLLRVAQQSGALVVETEPDADALRKLGIQGDIYVIASPELEDQESQRFYLGAIEIVYGRIIDPEKLPEPNLDTDGVPLVSIGGCSKEKLN